MKNVSSTIQRGVTDIVDLLGESELRRVLKQCGIRADKLSHYELFRAFCERETCLFGHRMQAQCAQILHGLLQMAIPADLAHCDEIWKSTSEALLFDSPTCDLLCKVGVDQTEHDGIGTILDHVAVCDHNRLLAANPLLKLRADSWDAWSAQISARLVCAVDSSDGILYRLPSSYADRAPNPYVISQVLKKNKRNVRDLSLLHAQLLRYLFAFCREQRVPLLLISRCEVSCFASLLTRLKREVGLPPLVCAVPMPPFEWLLDFATENGEVTLAIDATCNCAPRMLPQTLARLSREYPCGRITVIQ